MFSFLKSFFFGIFYNFFCLVLYLFDLIFDRHAKVVILCYKAIGKASPDSVSIDNFKKQIEVLLKYRRPVSLADVYYHILDTKALVKKSFAITFDGGDKSILLVRKFLKEKGIQPAVFVISGKRNFSGNSKYRSLSEKDLQKLACDSWDIGSCSDTYPDFSKLSYLDRKREIKDSKLKLKKAGFKVRFFAYPNGNYTNSIVSDVKKARYWMALSCDDDLILPKSNPYVVPRILVGNFSFNFLFLASISPSVILFNKYLKRFSIDLNSLRYTDKLDVPSYKGF